MIKLVKSFAERLGVTLKRFEFPNDNPIDILDILVHSRLRPDFFVVEIGANDGVSDDPAYAIIRKHHLSALLVEPLPSMFEVLRRNYADQPQVKCENVAIGPDGPLTLYQVKADASLPPYVSRLASFDRGVILKQKRSIPNIAAFIEPMVVQGASLHSLLAKHAITQIDWLQLDTEGFDFQILLMLWATKIRPEIISFESEHLSAVDKVACAKLLRDGSYRYVTFGRDTIAVKS